MKGWVGLDSMVSICNTGFAYAYRPVQGSFYSCSIIVAFGCTDTIFLPCMSASGGIKVTHLVLHSLPTGFCLLQIRKRSKVLCSGEVDRWRQQIRRWRCLHCSRRPAIVSSLPLCHVCLFSQTVQQLLYFKLVGFCDNAKLILQNSRLSTLRWLTEVTVVKGQKLCLL